MVPASRPVVEATTQVVATPHRSQATMVVDTHLKPASHTTATTSNKTRANLTVSKVELQVASTPITTQSTLSQAAATSKTAVRDTVAEHPVVVREQPINKIHSSREELLAVSSTQDQRLPQLSLPHLADLSSSTPTSTSLSLDKNSQSSSMRYPSSQM